MRLGRSMFEPVAITDRSGFDESVHFGAVVALDRAGEIALAVGDADLAIYPRSSCKPIQADAMRGAGWRGDPMQVALACASHDGTERHREIALSTLRAAGLTDAMLRNTPDLPLDKPTAEAYLAGGGERSSICQNCSGKHAAMVATCVINGWNVERYLEPDHPLQAAITDRMVELAGPVHHVGVDGCGAPAHVISLTGLARAFRTLAMAQGEVWSAVTAHPDLVGGPTRDVTRLIKAVPGLLAKDGAEGVFAAALPDGRSAAVKISDGTGRAAGVVIAAALAAVGVDVDPNDLGAPVLGHGRPVGRVRSVLKQ